MLSGSTAMGIALLCALVLSLPCSFTAVSLVRARKTAQSSASTSTYASTDIGANIQILTTTDP